MRTLIRDALGFVAVALATFTAFLATDALLWFIRWDTLTCVVCATLAGGFCGGAALVAQLDTAE